MWALSQVNIHRASSSPAQERNRSARPGVSWDPEPTAVGGLQARAFRACALLLPPRRGWRTPLTPPPFLPPRPAAALQRYQPQSRPRREAAGAKMAARVLLRWSPAGAGAGPRLPSGGGLTLRGMVSSASRPREDSWLKSLFVRKVDPRKDAHSNLLAKRETSSLYKLQIHNVKPECLEAYNKLCQEVLPKIHEEKHYPCALVGTWNTWYGEQDQAVHLWRYEGGYPALNEVMNKLRQNKEFTEFRKERGNMLLSRKNQLLLEFSFWNEPVPRAGPNIYELRSYQLRPGTMIEWGNYWARAIRFRQDNNEAVGGFFSQIGQLYMVHHLWAYKDLQTREDIRNAAWHKPGWDELVYYTVPLIQEMESRIMIPLKISPLQ